MKIMKTTFTLTRPLAMLTATFLFLAGMYAWQMLVRSPEPVSYTSMDESSFLSPTVESEIERLQARLEDSPNDAEAYAFLGLARLQQVRETGDASLYALAESALDEAIRLDPNQVDGLIGQGLLALARHDFRAALAWGEQAYALNAYRAQPLFHVPVDERLSISQQPQRFVQKYSLCNGLADGVQK